MALELSIFYVVHAPIRGRSRESVSTQPELWPRQTAWIGSIRLCYDQLCCWQWALAIFFLAFSLFERRNNSSQPKNEKSTARETRPALVEKMAMLEEIHARMSRCVFVTAVSWSINQSINHSIEQSLTEKYQIKWDIWIEIKARDRPHMEAWTVLWRWQNTKAIAALTSSTFLIELIVCGMWVNSWANRPRKSCWKEKTNTIIYHHPFPLSCAFAR